MSCARIRAGSGIGDALYLQAIVRHLAARGESLEVCTDYPELFTTPGLKFAPFSRVGITYTCHYTQDKHDERTTQFVDMCRRGGLRGVPALTLEWQARRPGWAETLRRLAAGRRILFVHGGREAFGRSDGFGRDLLPDATTFAAALEELRAQFFTVYVGRGRRLFPVRVDLDLNDQTTVTDMVDIAAVADAFYAQASFVIPLAECFDKRVLVCFAARGFSSRHAAVRTITPKKLLHKPTSTHFVDSWPHERISDAVRKFLNP